MPEQYKMLDTLLKYLTEEDYNALIEQEQLRLDGYNIHFVIDADLIGHYCYPKGINEEETSLERKSKLTADFIADEQVTLHSIFNLNKESGRVILFDEYAGEFEAMLLKASRRSSLHATIDLGLGSFKLTSLTDGNIFKEYLYDNFSKIVATVLVQLNGIKKASSLFDDKQIIFESSEITNPFLKQAVQSCRVLFQRRDKIISEWKTVLRRDLPSSKTRDAGVFDRLLSINHYIQEKGKGDDKKNVFILLTDAPSAKPLFAHLVNGHSDVKYPMINGRSIYLIRNVSQTFAYIISLVYKGKKVDTKSTIRNLSELKKTSGKVMYEVSNSQKLVGQYGSNKYVEVDLFSTEIFSNFRQLRNLFENTGLLKSFEGLHQSIKADINDLNHSDIQKLFERIQIEMKTLARELTDEHAQYLSKLYDEAVFSTTYLNGLELLNKSSVPLNLSKGNDFVEGTYQHLPIFLTFPLDSQNYRQHMNQLMLIILDRSSEKKKLSQQLRLLLEKMNIHKLDFDDQFEVKLLKAFILIIMPSQNDLGYNENRDRSEFNTNDEIAFKWLELLYDGGAAKFKTTNEHLYPDLLYELCWVARRMGDFSISLKYALEGKEAYPTDPRFHHGIFLAEYNLYEKDRSRLKVNDAIKSLDKMIDDIQLAQKYYLQFLSENFAGFNSNMMQFKIQDTFNNNHCYILSLKAAQLILKDPNDKRTIVTTLDSARERLRLLKPSGKYSEMLAEYYDTEAYLEYLESFYCNNPRDKIKNAKTAIVKAIMLSTSSYLKIKYQRKLDMIDTQEKDLSRIGVKGN